MTVQTNLESTIAELEQASRKDHLQMVKGIAKSIFRPIQPKDFKNAYLAISKEQGDHLEQLIKNKQIQNIVEFGTSFGFSTLFLAKGALETSGNIVTTELIESKANKALSNFKKAGVDHLIDLRVGDAMETLKGYDQPVDLLFLDGWKDLYLPLFRMLEPLFHQDTIVYVDNADMGEVKDFLKEVKKDQNYSFESRYGGKAVLITRR